ncbi:MAG: hypothetical protein EXS02_13685 [Planctomycetes bacterium]|nr:hypothetical protein [Planctomycetota bacterium]
MPNKKCLAKVWITTTLDRTRIRAVEEPLQATAGRRRFYNNLYFYWLRPIELFPQGFLGIVEYPPFRVFKIAPVIIDSILPLVPDPIRERLLKGGNVYHASAGMKISFPILASCAPKHGEAKRHK